MSGQNIARLAAAVAGMTPSDVRTSIDAWTDGATSLEAVSLALTQAAPRIRRGFGVDSQAGKAAEKVLTAMRDEVVTPRMADMTRASAALGEVRDAMRRAEAAQTAMPTSAPGEAPTYTGTAGETHEDITALKIYASKMRIHNQQVAAYGDADEKARQQVEDVNTTYRDAAAVMACRWRTSTRPTATRLR